jgi:hypothetical protein
MTNGSEPERQYIDRMERPFTVLSIDREHIGHVLRHAGGMQDRESEEFASRLSDADMKDIASDMWYILYSEEGTVCPKGMFEQVVLAALPKRSAPDSSSIDTDFTL